MLILTLIGLKTERGGEGGGRGGVGCGPEVWDIAHCDSSPW